MPKVVDFDKIREDLLYKSSRMIKKQGFLEMSMRDIASNLGVTTGKLYHYFRNKDEFLLELFEWISQKSIYELVKGICSVRDQKEKIHKFYSILAEQCEATRLNILLSWDVFRSNLSKKYLLLWQKRLYRIFQKHLKLEPRLSRTMVSQLIGYIYLSLLSEKPDTEMLWQMHDLLILQLEAEQKNGQVIRL